MVGISGTYTILQTPIDLHPGNVEPGTALVAGTTNKNISVGQTSIQDRTVQDQVEVARFNLEKTLQLEKYNNEKNLAFAQFLDNRQIDRTMKEAAFFYQVSKTYAAKADALIDLIKPSAIQVRYGECKTRKFLHIGDVWAFAQTNVSSDVIFTESVADLTGHGGSLSSLYSMSVIPVNGVTGSVIPFQSATLLVNSALIINGVTYFLDSWINNLGITQVGKAGTSNGTAGFTLDVQNPIAKIKWNNTLANGGFDLVNGDNISLTFWMV
jgi:hypothetical protein